MYNIAIDGPSGAGKSTLAKLIAKQLNILYLDTGAMYRAIGLKALNLNVSPTDASEVCAFLDDTEVEVKYIDGEMFIFLDGKDVSADIRRHEVSKAASDVSAIPQVRLKMVELQRQIASSQSLVLDGRDITSYVLPDAKYKFFLTASPEERAKRRFEELKLKGQDVTYERILNDIIQRDYNDSHRSFAPLTRTEDSIYIDTTALTKEQTLAKILDYIEEKI